MTTYLDNAATTYPKPESVYAAVDRYQRQNGAAAGRGGYDKAVQVSGTVQRCRQLAADLLGVHSGQHVVLTSNCTDSLNLVLHGLLRPGDHVITSQLEHNSVRRPLHRLRQQGVQVTTLSPGADHRIDPTQVRDAIRPETRLVAVLHASNVTGVVQPIEDIGEVARQHGARVLLDAAQTAGQLPIQMNNLPIDYLACAGHKGLLGPLGTGLLCLRPGAEECLLPVRQGGTGSHSESPEQPVEIPDRYEAGNLNVPGIYGLTAGLDFLTLEGVASIRIHEIAILERLSAGLRDIRGVDLYADQVTAADRIGVLSCNVGNLAPHDAATILDQSFGIQTRAGLHCAPGAHEALGTMSRGGTLRLSPGPFTTPDEIDAVVAAIREIAQAT